VIQHPRFSCEPWAVCETELDLSVLPHSESIFALSNGHIGMRANLEEGEPHGLPGTYLNSFYETRPLPYAEGGYGYPEAGQAVVNVTNGKIIRLLVDDEPFDVRYGTLRWHQRTLDFRAGVLRREVEWISPAGQGVRITSVRLVSFSHRAIAAIHYEVEPLDEAARVVVQSELVANEPLPAAIRSSLTRVRCTMPARSSECACCSETSGDRSAAAARGSSVTWGTGSLATSSDCTTMRAGASTGSTS